MTRKYSSKLDKIFYDALVESHITAIDNIGLSKTLSKVLINHAIKALKPVHDEYGLSDAVLARYFRFK